MLGDGIKEVRSYEGSMLTCWGVRALTRYGIEKSLRTSRPVLNCTVVVVAVPPIIHGFITILTKVIHHNTRHQGTKASRHQMEGGRVNACSASRFHQIILGLRYYS